MDSAIHSLPGLDISITCAADWQGEEGARREGALEYRARVCAEADSATISVTVRNTAPDAIALETLLPFGALTINETAFTHAYLECQALLGEVGAYDLTDGRPHISYGALGLMPARYGNGLLLGFTDVTQHFCFFEARRERGMIIVTPRYEYEGVMLGGGETLSLESLSLLGARPMSVLLAEYARLVAKDMPARRAHGVKTGWCSWYQYYSTESREDILHNANVLSQSPLAGTLQVILLDDGWNLKDNESGCVWGDWHAGGKFPSGMKEMADSIRKAGFEAGIWLAPFAVAKGSALYKAHPEWLIGAADGLVDNNASVYGLDLTHPGAREFVRDTFTRVFDEWGFDYVKLDFLLYAVTNGRRYDASISSVQALRRGMEIINECARGRFILACGAPVMALVGLCDGMRVGADVGSQWYFPLNEGAWPMGNCALKPAFRYAASRHWQHGVFWQNDPDCLVARGRGNDAERAMFRKFFPHMRIDDAKFGLKQCEALAFVKLLWFTGGMWFLSDDWEALPPDRQCIARMCLTPNAEPVLIADEYGDMELLVMRSAAPGKQFAVFNIGDDRKSLLLPRAAYPGMAAEYQERFSGEVVCAGNAELELRDIAPHSGYVYQRL